MSAFGRISLLQLSHPENVDNIPVFVDNIPLFFLWSQLFLLTVASRVAWPWDRACGFFDQPFLLADLLPLG